MSSAIYMDAILSNYTLGNDVDDPNFPPELYKYIRIQRVVIYSHPGVDRIVNSELSQNSMF